MMHRPKSKPCEACGAPVKPWASVRFCRKCKYGNKVKWNREAYRRHNPPMTHVVCLRCHGLIPYPGFGKPKSYCLECIDAHNKERDKQYDMHRRSRRRT